MASNSDHDNTRTNIVDVLPTVYQSDVNKVLFEASFNKFLTKDDTTHIAGYVGTGNAAALVDRQLPEPTPHRKAFQLAPVMYSTVGTEEYTLTFKGFQQQLQLMGVDVENMDTWGKTERFNWIPPVNPDMLINYTDYFWKPATGQTPPQHFTIENRCNKATSKLNAYKAIIARRGATMAITRIDFANNAFVVANKHDDLFVDEFMFNTKNSGNINLDGRTWIASSSSYNGSTNETTIVVSPEISIRTDIVDVTNQPPAPTAVYAGQWWYKYSSTVTTPLSQLFTWTGSVWVITGQAFPCLISLEDQEAVYQAEVNCACESDTGGWDTKQWDDNQTGALVWNTDLLAEISFATEAEWITNNTQTSAFDLWYDLTSDELKQRDAANSSWTVVRESFSDTITETTGTALWDASVGCTLQEYDQWSTSNSWVHKSELTTFVGAKRAQVPILEYSSQTERNEWTETTHAWKYRTETGRTFESSTAAPNRLELEPIKSYVASNTGGVWSLFLTTEHHSANRDIDYSSIFTNGYKFRIVDSNGLSELFTSNGAVYREIGSTDPLQLPRGKFCTIIELREHDFPAPETAGTKYEPTTLAPHTRIEPIRTSTGDPWKGYHIHWLLDVTATSHRATSTQMANPYIKSSDTSSAETIPAVNGSLYVTETYQEFTPSTNNVSQVDLHYSFRYDADHPGYYAVVGENSIRVYINGVRQYGTYREVAFSSQATPDYTVVDGIELAHGITQTKFNYVYAIQFNHALAANDVVRIEIAPPSFYDMGMYAVPVRTIEDDAEFKAAVLTHVQPAYKNLMKYHRNEQVKTQINQYPLFNVYDIITGEVITTSPIFAFVESVDYPVNSSTQRRIVASTDGKEYEFEQFLVDKTDGVLYAYRTLTDTVPSFWYNPLTETLKKWDGKTWATTILSTITTGLIAHVPFISAIEPTHLHNVSKSVWVNPDTLEFWERDTINGKWITLDGTVEISTADPTLNTIWRTSETTPEYVPQFVDDHRAPVQKGSALGDWEVVSQWKNNPEHENHKTILFSQLYTHLTQVVSQQNRIPGLTNRGIFTLRQHEYDFGVGGTIKEHNDSYDTLISAVNLTEVTPVSVIEFAQEQYTSNLVIIRDIFNTNIIDLLIGETANINEFCIGEFERNDFVAKVYGDSTAYNQKTSVGMPNWIATAPMFGLAPKVKPTLINDGTSSILIHHDGHRSFVSYTLAEQDRMARGLVARKNRSNPGTAVISSTQPTGVNLPVFWYYVGNGHHELYRLKSSINVEWELIDFVDLLGNLYLEIEQRLYDASPAFPIPVFDFDQLTASEESAAVYETRLYDRFMNYVTKRDIKAPLINTGYSITDPYTWNYSQCVLDTPPTTAVTPTARACWQALYEAWYGTPYPNLEPWRLQGFTDKPTWWDNEYLDHTESRRWKYNHATKTGMWENIRVGKIPAGYAYPNSSVVSTGDALADGIATPKYNYFSVNISDDTLAGGYLPDDILPPYFDNTTIAPTHPTVRSLFRVFTTQIISPSTDFAFGDIGPTEWEWSISSERVYDRSIIAFLMHPVKFLHQTFGIDYVTVKGLQVDVITKKVYTHKEAMFHGDIYDTNKTYTANGMNQWYVNLNRFRGYDTNVGFRDMWTGWVPRQSYQTAGIIDTGTLQVFNKNFDITSKDYDIVLSNSGVLTETWVDAFDVSIINIPSAVIQYNNQAQWKFSVDTLSPVSRNIQYYGVQLWPFAIDPVTDILTAFSFKITGISAAVSIFDIPGDQTPFITEGITIKVTGSSTNDGDYTVARAIYDTVGNITKVKVTGTVATSIADGAIDIVDYAHNWATGDIVVMSSTTMLPYPIADQTPYYVIRTDSRRIKLADSATNAAAGIAVDITSAPTGQITIGKVSTSFQVFGGTGNSSELWYHYQLNKLDVRSLQAPDIMVGMQSLVSFIDGYKALQEDRGIVFNRSADFVEYDSDTGMPLTWQLETERFINWAYGLRRARLQINDRFAFTVSSLTENTLRFTTSAPAWAAGSTIALTTTGSLPESLFAQTPYYFKPTEDPQVFKLCATKRLSDADVVDLTTVGSGNMFTSLYIREQAYPSFEINPARNNVWVSTPQGMLSNVLSGPYSDIRVSQTIYDQYGRFLTADKITVFREDTMNRVSVRSEITNDVELYPNGFFDPYNYLHIGGGHYFTEGYEHIVMFNDYSVGGDLIYDPFLGLHTTRFDVDYHEKTQWTMRPTLGGHFLTGNLFKRNFEGSLHDMRRYYDAFELTEGTTEAQYARHLLGYHPNDGSMSYLDLLNTNSKSQFLFYRGMIQSKGSVNSINAYINSKKFVDAKIDEFWMYKIGEFGDSRAKIYPKLRLYADDILNTDIRLKFVLASDIDTEVLADKARGFETVSFNNGTRWADFPQQREEIVSPLFLDASITSMTRFYTTQSSKDALGAVTYLVSPPLVGQSTIDYWVDLQTSPAGTSAIFWKWVDGSWVDASSSVPFRIRVVGSTVYLKTGHISDGVRFIRQRLTSAGNLLAYQSELMNEADYVNGYSRVNSEVVKFESTSANIHMVSNENEIIVDDSGANQYAPGDKVKLDSVANKGIFTVASAEYKTVGSTSSQMTHIKIVEPLTAVAAPGDGTITHYGFSDILIMFCVAPSADKINPARLFDTSSHVKIDDIPLWHPAYGIHSTQAIHNVDLVRDTDPARYSVTALPGGSSTNAWSSPEVGTVWLDTSSLSYMPYYDDIVTPDVDNRIHQWGKRPEWSDVNVYQWVETLTPPSDWDDTATKQEGDITIPQKDKVTGTARKTVFKRTRNRSLINVVLAGLGFCQQTTFENTLADGDTIFITAPDNQTLPETVVAGTEYYVDQYNPSTFEFHIIDIDGNQVDLTGATQLYIVPPFDDGSWVRKPLLTERVFAVMEYDYTSSVKTIREPVLTVENTLFANDDIVDVYVNGNLLVQNVSVVNGTVNTVGTEYKMSASDIIDVVRPLPSLTEEQLAYDSVLDEDGTVLEQWSESIEYTEVSRVINSVTYTYYYFWVKNMATLRRPTDKDCISAKQIAIDIANPPTPYLMVQDPVDDLWARGYDVPPWDKTGYDGSLYSAYLDNNQFLPQIFYRKAVLSKVSQYVTEDNRYIVEFTRDLTLRNTLEVDHNQMNVKNKHEKWFMFRREQIGAVPHELWIKMTEALMECRYDDFGVRVPSFEREHYDLVNGTETRYGLETDQIFANPAYARATLISYLQDPSNNFAPVDITRFFETYPLTQDSFWKKPAEVKKMCDYIFNTFDSAHTNGIWFDILSDALVTKAKYKGLMKTSWLALHGIRILDVAGLFDDY